MNSVNSVWIPLALVITWFCNVILCIIVVLGSVIFLAETEPHTSHWNVNVIFVVVALVLLVEFYVVATVPMRIVMSKLPYLATKSAALFTWTGLYLFGWYVLNGLSQENQTVVSEVAMILFVLLAALNFLYASGTLTMSLSSRIRDRWINWFDRNYG